MVAVQEKISKAAKSLPGNLKWDGKSTTFTAFKERIEEWTEIRLGEQAAAALEGLAHDEHGDSVP